MDFMLRSLCAILVGTLLLGSSQSQTQSEKPPIIKGGAGPCSLELKVVDSDGKPVYAATVKVHIAYRFGGFHRLDLEAGTDSDGKVTFTGLPQRVSHPPLEFRASRDELTGMVSFDPAVECQSKQGITIENQKQTSARSNLKK
jgi:hypothetical protein